MSTYRLGTLASLELSITTSALVTSLVTWLVLAGLAIGLLGLGAVAAIVGALAAVLLHWLAEVWHQLGHAWAARRTGHPMTGIRLWLLLGTSLYPRDEKSLPAQVHIRRALGGPAASLLLTVAAAVPLLLSWPPGGWLGWLALVFFADSLLFFTVGALLPLGFTDGSTLLKWWGKR